jgi:hypothetical protein
MDLKKAVNTALLWHKPEEVIFYVQRVIEDHE